MGNRINHPQIYSPTPRVNHKHNSHPRIHLPTSRVNHRHRLSHLGVLLPLTMDSSLSQCRTSLVSLQISSRLSQRPIHLAMIQIIHTDKLSLLQILFRRLSTIRSNLCRLSVSSVILRTSSNKASQAGVCLIVLHLGRINLKPTQIWMMSLHKANRHSKTRIYLVRTRTNNRSQVPIYSLRLPASSNHRSRQIPVCLVSFRIRSHCHRCSRTPICLVRLAASSNHRPRQLPIFLVTFRTRSRCHRFNRAPTCSVRIPISNNNLSRARISSLRIQISNSNLNQTRASSIS